MKKIILLFFVVFSLVSCNEKTQKQFEEINDNYDLNSAISGADKILIRLKKPNQTELTMTDSCFESIAKYKAEKPSEIESFKKLFEGSEHTDYCCCPESNLSVGFYKESKEIDTYFVDTIEFKDKVRFYEKAYQCSYIIGREKWKSYLKAIRTK